MTIERIQYFLDLVETLNYTETAENFYTTQGNISKQIIALEKELEVTLFLREHRSITLSPAGVVVLPLARTLYEDYRQMLKALHPFKDKEKQTLSICSIPILSHYNVPEILSEFTRIHREIKLDIKEVETINLLPALDNGTFEIAWTRLLTACGDKYEKVVLDYDELAAVLPEHHPLASRNSISLSDLENETFLQLDENTNQFQLFHRLCREAGFKPNIGYTGTRLENILSFLSSGMGVSVLMRRSVKTLREQGIVIIPLEKTVSSELVFLRLKKKTHSSACQAFWKFLNTKTQF